MGRRAKDPEIRKKEFIDAALELFSTKGFDETSVTDITKRVGVSHGAFFYYYKSKDDIIGDVIDVLLEMNARFVKGLADDRDMSAKEKLKAIVNTSINSYKTMSCDRLTENFHSPSNLGFHKDYSRKSRELLNPLFVEIPSRASGKAIARSSTRRKRWMPELYHRGAGRYVQRATE